jgi:hypothetical protein
MRTSDATEHRCNIGDGCNDFVDVGGVECNRKRINASEFLEQLGFAFEHRDRRFRTDVTETEHGSAVTDDGNHVALHREVAHARLVFGNGHAHTADTRCVDHGKIITGLDRKLRDHRDLAAEVGKEHAVAVFQQLHIGQRPDAGHEFFDVLGRSGVDGDVPNDVAPFDAHDVDGTHVAAHASDFGCQPAQRSRTVEQAAASSECE